MRNNRGIIPAIYLLAIAAVAAVALVPSLHLPAFLQKKPPTAQLSQAEIDLARTRADLASAQARLDAAQTARDKATHDQTQYSQQMLAGVPLALAKAAQSPEVVLASQLATRAQIGLAAAIGDLPADRQAEIALIVDHALSAKQAEVDSARAALAQRDADLAATTKAKVALESTLPDLKATLEAEKAKEQVGEATVAQKAAEVSKWADLKAQADAKAGSLDAYAGNLVRILLIGAILYLVCHFILPSLAAEFPASSLLSGLYRTTTSLVSSHTVTTKPPKT